jgi:phosphoribosylformimino-5-aminoimidazole carboxamide ribotide isomerase
MRVIPVIDLLNRRVVRGIGGRRDEYQPIRSLLVDSAEPGAIAAALVERFGLKQIYVADLDAIMHGNPDRESWLAIGKAGCSLLIDAGIATADQAGEIWNFLGANLPDSEAVIGLESLASLAELETMTARGLPPGRTYLSLDLRGGVPLARDPKLKEVPLDKIVEEAARVGISQFILLDLADVGSGRGTSTLPLLKRLSAQFPRCAFVAGGGVRGADDLRALQDAGAAGALVASALHDGRLTAADCRAWE